MSRASLQARAKRVAAARARRLSVHLAGEDRERVLAFALDLETEADALERAEAGEALLAIPPMTPQAAETPGEQRPSAEEPKPPK